jgi:hypothetical protein
MVRLFAAHPRIPLALHGVKRAVISSRRYEATLPSWRPPAPCQQLIHTLARNFWGVDDIGLKASDDALSVSA